MSDTTHPILAALPAALSALGRGPDVDDAALATLLHALHARLSESDTTTRRHLREAAQHVCYRDDHRDDRLLQRVRHAAAQAEGDAIDDADRALGDAERARRARRGALARLVSDATLVAQRVRRGEWSREEGVGVHAVPEGEVERLAALLSQEEESAELLRDQLDALDVMLTRAGIDRIEQPEDESCADAIARYGTRRVALLIRERDEARGEVERLTVTLSRIEGCREGLMERAKAHEAERDVLTREVAIQVNKLADVDRLLNEAGVDAFRFDRRVGRDPLSRDERIASLIRERNEARELSAEFRAKMGRLNEALIAVGVLDAILDDADIADRDADGEPRPPADRIRDLVEQLASSGQQLDRARETIDDLDAAISAVDAALHTAGVPRHLNEPQPDGTVKVRGLSRSERVTWLVGLADAVRDERDAALEEVERLREQLAEVKASRDHHAGCRERVLSQMVKLKSERDAARAMADSFAATSRKASAALDEAGIPREDDGHPLALVHRVRGLVWDRVEAATQARDLRAEVDQLTRDRDALGRSDVVPHLELREAARWALDRLAAVADPSVEAACQRLRDALAQGDPARLSDEARARLLAADAADYTTATMSTAQAERDLAPPVDVGEVEV